MLQIIDKVFKSDANVRKVVLYRMWTMLAGVLVVVFVPRYLTNDMQGYYYTFQSIVALQVLFDLGLAQTIAQVTSHEYAHVGTVIPTSTADDVRVAKLSYVKATVSRWYRWMGSIFVLSVVVFGSGYFVYFGHGFAWTWFGPWIALVISTGINLVLSPRIAMVEGAGWTGIVANLRLVHSVVGHCLLVICLVAGGQLWSIVAVPVSANVASLIWLRWSRNPYRQVPAYVAAIHDHLPWRREIMGLQWRVAVAWLGGYFASQIIVPVVFALRGPDEAGKIGLGLQIFTAVQALGMSWISARIPIFGQLISRGQWATLKSKFAKATISAAVVSTVFSLAVALVLEVARHRGLFLADRIPSGFGIGCLVAVSAINTIIYALAAYMRSHKEEPLVISSLVIGFLNFAGALLGGMFGTDEVIAAYTIVTVLVNLPWTVRIFKSFYGRDTTGNYHSERAHVAG